MTRRTRLSSLGIDITQEVIDKHRWYAFWDAPLSIPGYTPAAWRGQGGGAGRRRRRRPRRRQAPPAPTLGQGGTIAEQVAALQSGSRGKPGYNPNPESARLHRRPRHGRSHGQPRGDPPRRVRVLGVVVRGQERRRQPGGDLPGDEARHLRRQPPIHRVSRDEPYADGCHRADERTVGGVQVRRGFEGILDGDDAAGDVARHGRPSAAASVRRTQGERAVGRPRVEPAARGRRPARVGRDVPAAAHVLLHARSGREPRLRLLSQRRRRRPTASASRCPRPSRTRSRNTSRTTRCTTRLPARGRRCRCSSTPVRRQARRRDRRRWRSRTTTSSRRFRATRRSSTTSISAWSTGCAWAGSTRRSRI